MQRKNSCVLYFHGNAQNRSAHFINLHWLVKEGFDLYIFDYPGYGQSKGTPSPRSTVRSAVKVIEYVQNQNCKNIIVYGHSLGGQIAMRALWELKESFTPLLLVIDSSFLSYKEVARKTLLKSAWTWLFSPLSYLLISDSWAIGDKIKDLHFEKIIIHSKSDEVIPFELGEEIFLLNKTNAQFWIKNKGAHNNTYFDPEGLKLRKKLLVKINSILK